MVQDMKLSFVKVHGVMFVKINQPCVEGAVVRRGKGNAISDVIRASIRPNWQDVCRVYQTELHAGHGATVAICKQNLLTKTGETG